MNISGVTYIVKRALPFARRLRAAGFTKKEAAYAAVMIKRGELDQLFEVKKQDGSPLFPIRDEAYSCGYECCGIADDGILAPNGEVIFSKG